MTINPTIPNSLILGDALEVLRKLPSDSVDAIVTDPPAGISFMGKGWDSSKGGRAQWVSWLAEIMAEALRVLKPGGHALVWSLPRTSHWTALALEDAGFEIRDSIEHIFGSGFPKSHDVSKAIDKIAGAEREVIGINEHFLKRNPHTAPEDNTYNRGHKDGIEAAAITAPATPAAQAWNGWGTALKPAHETWWLARKPLAEKSIAENVLTYGTGAINIDACRVGDEFTVTHSSETKFTEQCYANGQGYKPPFVGDIQHDKPGRWPANLLISHTLECQPEECADGCPVKTLDKQSGHSKSSNHIRHTSVNTQGYDRNNKAFSTSGPLDQGGASRYFQQFYYVAKPSRRERSAGCEELPPKFLATMNDGIGGREHNPDEPGAWTGNNHPTVKPINLMRYLISLITPENGIVLDMFGGSGTTALAAIEERKRFLLIEREQDYFNIASARIAHKLATSK